MKIIKNIIHASFLVSDLNKSLEFYVDTLGLEPDFARPDLGYPGAWLNAGNQQIHLMQLPNPDSLNDRPEHGGRDRHVAFEVTDIAELKQAFDSKNISYTLSKSGRQAMFCRDPDANALEFVEISHL